MWLSVELLLAAGISAGTCILRRAETRARLAWHDNPTLETQVALDRERAITFRHHVVFAAILFGGMAAFTIPLVRLASKRGNL
jgi:hypothetical protein